MPVLPPNPNPPQRRWALAWLLGCAALAALAAAALAALLEIWLPAGAWAGPLAAALVAAVVAPALTWHVLRLRGALQQARLRAADGSAHEGAAGLLPRNLFLGFVEREWSRAGRYGGTVALLLVEVDRLRPLVDSSGAWVADALVAALSHDIQKRLRGADLLARYADAQIAVFLPHADPTGALDVADRIRAGVARIDVPGLPATTALTASVGVVVMRPQLHPLAALLNEAGAAVQTAVEAGGDCVRTAPPDRRRGKPLRRPTSGGHRAGQ